MMMISAQEANTIIVNSIRPLSRVTISIEHALHSVLAQDIIASGHVPPFDNSAMDGYAVRSDDVKNVPCVLKIVGEIPAGVEQQRELRTGETMNIMTGGKIPGGCNAVIQQEWTECLNDSKITILKIVDKGHNIRKAGADIQKGSVVLPSGTRLRPQQIGVLASLGKQFIEVYRKPSVAIIATGNEIVEIDKPLANSQIRNSNAYTLEGLVREAGGEPKILGIARDDRDELEKKLATGLTSDILITTGGVSVGKYDLVVEVLKELGVEIKFWKVNIKPGMPLMFGCCRDTLVFGLPGNPVSAMVTFMQFVTPAVRTLMGDSNADVLPKIYAALQHEIQKTDGKRHFMRGVITNRQGMLSVRTTGSQVSNILTSLTNANCLIIIPEEVTHLRAGDRVEVEMLS